jgi:hypothetical protein
MHTHPRCAFGGDELLQTLPQVFQDDICAARNTRREGKTTTSSPHRRLFIRRSNALLVGTAVSSPEGKKKKKQGKKKNMIRYMWTPGKRRCPMPPNRMIFPYQK